jgi:hypothetical protein
LRPARNVSAVKYPACLVTCRTPNLCSIRRLPGHPCESDASGSGGRRRASLCAPRPRGPKRPYPCWSAFRCSRAYRPLASGGHRGSRRWPPPSPVPRLRHDRRFSSSVATQAATWPPGLGPARTHQYGSPTGPTGAWLLCS